MTQELLTRVNNLNDAIHNLECIATALKRFSEHGVHIYIPGNKYVQSSFLELAIKLKEDCQKDLEAL